MGLLRRSRTGNDAVAADGAVLDEVVPLADVMPRQRVRTVGQVVRMRARPTSGEPSLAVTLSDGAASITVVWTGRRAIGGITLGRRLLVEGVCRPVGATGSASAGAPLEMTNPSYTLLP